jgi:hypothetical protein
VNRWVTRTGFENGFPTSVPPIDRVNSNVVWTFGHAIREVERSHQHLIMEETATWGATLLFGSAALLTLIVFRSLVGISIAVFFAAFALCAAVRSSFSVDRTRQCLIVTRRIGSWTFRKKL